MSALDAIPGDEMAALTGIEKRLLREKPTSPVKLKYACGHEIVWYEKLIAISAWDAVASHGMMEIIGRTLHSYLQITMRVEAECPRCANRATIIPTAPTTEWIQKKMQEIKEEGRW